MIWPVLVLDVGVQLVQSKRRRPAHLPLIAMPACVTCQSWVFDLWPVSGMWSLQPYAGKMLQVNKDWLVSTRSILSHCDWAFQHWWCQSNTFVSWNRCIHITALKKKYARCMEKLIKQLLKRNAIHVIMKKASTWHMPALRLWVMSTQNPLDCT